MNKYLYILTLNIFFVACNTTTDLANTQEKKLFFEAIKLVDTFTNELIVSDLSRVADYHPLYIGKIQDSVTLDYNGVEIVEERKRLWDMVRNLYPEDSTLSLNIYVDTNQIIGSYKIGLPPPPPPRPDMTETDIDTLFMQWEKDLPALRGEVASYPVYIHNRDTLSYVGYGKYIPLILEAKNKEGEWHSIQEPYRYHCGTGLKNFYLLENELLVTNCPIISGSFQTQLRLAFGSKHKQYSNEFDGSIDPKYFEQTK